MSILVCSRCGERGTQTWSGMCPPCYRIYFGSAEPRMIASNPGPVPLCRCVERLVGVVCLDCDGRVEDLRMRAFVAEVRRHVVGECDGITPTDCLEAIRLALVGLERPCAAKKEG